MSLVEHTNSPRNGRRLLEDNGVKVVTVIDNKAPQKVMNGEMIPAFTNNGRKYGRAFRSCTGRWKIQTNAEMDTGAS